MKKRLFLAINLPVVWKDVLVKWQKNYNYLPDIKWMPVENLHMTVAFLGGVEEEKIKDLIKAIQRPLNLEVKNGFNLEMRFKQLTLAPPKGLPRMLWINFFTNQAYSELVNKVWQAAGPWIDKSLLIKRKKPLAHITLARFKQPLHLTNLPQPVFIQQSFKADKLLLMESILTASRPYYRQIAEFLI